MTDSTYRKLPRWTEPFLFALPRTGEVREAAKWAGVDFTTAYARRKAHSEGYIRLRTQAARLSPAPAALDGPGTETVGIRLCDHDQG